MGRKARGNNINGWLILDKPQGLTSTQALARVKRLLQPKKAGHAGTLDPLATGLLPIALGEATKTVSFVMQRRKVYRFTVRWGAKTNTDDAEGEVQARAGHRPSADEITAQLARFVGDIEQRPPQFSAVKVKGERAYAIARKGGTSDLPPRPVTVHSLQLIDAPDADTAIFEATCGKGVYVRAIARDLGEQLGCYGHVEALRRLQVGPFCQEDMILLAKLEELRNTAQQHDGLAALVLPVATALDDIPALAVDLCDAVCLKRGQRVLFRGKLLDAGTLVVATCQGKPVAIGAIERGAIVPKRVFNLPV